MLLSKSSICFNAILAYPNDLGIKPFEFVGSIPEPNAFGNSAGCIGLRIKPQDDSLSPIIA
jgi:hypothetical protein